LGIVSDHLDSKESISGLTVNF